MRAYVCAHVCIYIHIYISVYIYVCVCLCVYGYIRICEYICICMYLCMYVYRIHVISKIPIVNDHVIEVTLGLLLQPRQGLGVDVAEVAEDRQPRGPRDVVGGRIGPEPEELRPAQIAANPVNWFKTK
jgi:hypothetical protein